MAKSVKKLFYTMGIALLAGATPGLAQMLDQAKELYNEGRYEEAKPLFEKLVKQAPGNASYNHWLGVCCLETGDLPDAEKYLKAGVKRKVQESYRYLGELYYNTYRFGDAGEMFDEYITLLAKKKQDTEAYEVRRELASKAARMMDKVEDVRIIDSLVVDKDGILSAYTLSEEAGSLALYRDFFQTTKPDNSVVYMNQRGDKIYYSQDTGENQGCVFTQSRLMDHWGDEKRLPMNVNSEEDDGYPFVLPDGVTIYYASKGNGSLGGYDLFVTRYNTNTGSYLSPEQLGMPYNSPYNDYMMVIDEAKELGWFVSDRFQPEGKACVYLFIPDNNHDRVESDDIEWKKARAAIASIRDSWGSGANYADLIELAHMEIPYGRVETQKDFTFPIHDDIVYYTLDDIQCPEARNYYGKVIALGKQIQDLAEKLDGWRASYIKANKQRREQLKANILDAEEQLYALSGQPEEWEKKARNAEINYLNTHK